MYLAQTTHPYKYFTHISTSYTTYSTSRPQWVNDTDDRPPVSVARANLFTGVHGRPPLPLRPESTGTGQRRPAETRYLRPSPGHAVSQLTINANGDDNDDDNGSSDPIPRLLVNLLITSSIGPRLGSTSAVVFMAPVGSLNCGRPGWHHCAVAAAAAATTATCRPVLSVSLGRVGRL
ncbi:unnamed protein product [Macrosiphum euphorbiae]|uniref:Uncharacterized protein n=1 Tax=Macrosiphum euphorbiae TaxID=13131 RepID=A0AAV0X0J9_9HEMI|nr:unnamed protein product [Macrosiphum euphorbiae]